MSCSSKSFEERSPFVSWLLSGGPFDQKDEYDAEFNETVKETKTKNVKRIKQKRKQKRKKK